MSISMSARCDKCRKYYGVDPGEEILICKECRGEQIQEKTFNPFKTNYGELRNKKTDDHYRHEVSVFDSLFGSSSSSCPDSSSDSSSSDSDFCGGGGESGGGGSSSDW